MNEKRQYGIDLIKTIAIFFVISVHFFLNSGYYGNVMAGGTMFVSTFFRHLFFLCVPFFLISTGFLRCRKNISKKYYMSLIPVYISYLLAAVLVNILKYQFSDIPFDGFIYEVLSILSFKSGYFWYMEMFFGLALFVPFINTTYNSLDKRIHKKILILIMLILTGLFSLKIKLTTENKTYYLFSDFWVFLYPVTYYLYGMYINEYRPKINKLLGIISVIILLTLETIFTYFSCKGGYFNWGTAQDNGGFFVIVNSVILFLVFYDIDIKNKILCKIIADISKKTLDIYMISYIFDLIAYGFFKKLVPDYLSSVKYAPILVLSVFFASYAYATVKSVVFNIFGKKEKKNAVSTNI